MNITKSVEITMKELKQCVMESIKNEIELISIVRTKSKAHTHWIEKVLICDTPDKTASFGVSFKNDNGNIRATVIFLDAYFIENQNALTGSLVKFDVLSNFKSGIRVVH